MISRKKKLRIIQLNLLILGLIIIFFTYMSQKKNNNQTIISQDLQKKITKNFSNDKSEGDVFYDVSYSGFDLSGNRYLLKSKEARTDRLNSQKVNLKYVEAFFYFKDDSILKIESEECIYNNNTLDMKFKDNVRAYYGESTLLADNAEYLSSKNYLIISDNVKINDIRGEMKADRLFFDLKKNTLDISSYNDNSVNANLNYNEKKF